MKKQKVYREFIELAQAFLALTVNWSPKRVAKCVDNFMKDNVLVESTIALPVEWETRFTRLGITARIALLTKGKVTNDSFAIVKKNLSRATIFIAKDGNTYLRLNNLLIRLV